MKPFIAILLFSSLSAIFIACNSKAEQPEYGKPVETDLAVPNLPVPTNSDSLTPEQFEAFMSELEQELKELDPAEMQDMINGTVATMQAELPAEIEEGMMMSDVQVSDDAFSYIILCDEYLIDMEEFEKAPQQDREELKSMMKISVDNPENAVIATICKIAGKDIKYIFIGSDSGKQFDITFKHEEL